MQGRRVVTGQIERQYRERTLAAHQAGDFMRRPFKTFPVHYTEPAQSVQPPNQTQTQSFVLYSTLYSVSISPLAARKEKPIFSLRFLLVTVFLYSCIYTHDPQAEHGQATPDVSCSCPATSSSYAGLVSSTGSGATSLDSSAGFRGPCGVPNRVENI